jgi:nucleoside-diphosphate-sugar epimerase
MKVNPYLAAMNDRAYEKPIISILGCGWYGMALGMALAKEGFLVKGSTTSSEKLPSLKANGIEPYLVTFEKEQTQFDAAFFDCEILIISIPPRRNSPDLNDYPNKIANIAIAAQHVKQVLFISSTGVYPEGNFIVNETNVPQPNSDSGKVMYAAEEILRSRSFTTTVVRFGGLIGPERTLTKHFAGKTAIANGVAPINLIHLNDCIGLTKAIIEHKAFGLIYHGVTPDHPSRADFYTKNCLAHGLAKPNFINELLTWKQIESINVPQMGYEYQIKNWDDWLKNIS